MLKSSLLEILRTFTKQEMIKFEDFLRSPYFNKKENVLKFFLVIKKYAPAFDNGDLEKETIWKKQFPDKKYNYGIMKNLIHDLGKLTETFITLEFYNKADYKKDRDLIYSMYFRDLPKLSLAKTKIFENNFKNQFHKNDIFSFSHYMENAIHVYDLKQRLLYSNNDKSDKMESIDLACEYTVYNFLYISFIYYQNILKLKLDRNKEKIENLLEYFLGRLDGSEILEELIDLIKKKPDKLSKTIMCFYYSYKSLSTNNSVECYYNFKNFLKENISMFPVDEWDSLYQILASCLSNLKLPNLENNKETFEINQMIFSKGLIYANTRLIPYSRFISVIENSCILGKTKFAEIFLDEYKHMLPEDVKENTGYYSLARIAFAKSEFQETLNLLSKIQNEPLMLKYYIKNLYMMSCYELKYYEPFLNALDSFRHFAKRNKLSNEVSQISFSKFGENIKTLFKLRENFESYEFEKMCNLLKENKSVHSTWLDEQLAAIKKLADT